MAIQVLPLLQSRAKTKGAMHQAKRMAAGLVGGTMLIED